jgi:hypothetical protein
MTTSVHRTSIAPLNWAVAGTIALLPALVIAGFWHLTGPSMAAPSRNH